MKSYIKLPRGLKVSCLRIVNMTQFVHILKQMKLYGMAFSLAHWSTLGNSFSIQEEDIIEHITAE